jgi:AbrB family looped-hinge helix DNA binding protein
MATRIKHGPRRRGYTRLSSKRQVTVPLVVTEELKLQPGDELKVEVDGKGRIVLTPAMTLAQRRLAAIEATAGSMTGIYEPGYLEKLRNEWR